MIDLEFLESLIRALDQSSVDSIEIERGGTRVRLSKTPNFPVALPGLHYPMPAHAAPTPLAPTSASPHGERPPGEAGGAPAAAAESRSKAHLQEVKSPMVGTFYQAPAPDAPPYVQEGSRIAKGDTLCIIEAMKLMNELVSDLAGTVVEVLIDNGEPVEYGQVLFRVDPG
jgi:acetyl-CoA carboxylase biotin carboxyl carrier protein